MTSDRNHLSVPGKHSRREFLRRGALVAGAGFATPFALELAGLARAVQVGDDYRALVCLFLYGGNDHYDTFVPNDPTSRAAYMAARADIAQPAGSVLPINPIGGFQGAGTFGFAPEFAGLKSMFDAGNVAVVSNIGTLIRPIDKAGYENRSNRPPQLFSHNDQQSYWQASSPEGATTGWGGRIGDLMLDSNGSNTMFTCISVSGNAVLMTGRDAFQYQVSSRGVTTLRNDTFRYDPALAGMREVMELQQGGLFPSTITSISTRALDSADQLSTAVDAAANRYDLDAYFDTESPNTSLARTASQLKMVARLIAAGRDTLGLKRQVFFVSMGGFDNHDGLLNRHRPLLQAIDGSLTGFHDATRALGISDRVTTFTASDFGRTLVSNGDGSDHGWGGHHVVMGGSVRGRRVYGDVPVIADDGPDDVGRGRLLPTTSVDQFAATFARWMGAESNELGAVVPNIGNYNVTDLGFLRDPNNRLSAGIEIPADNKLAPAKRIPG
jgi:uncharacterized protein (DUF1501 family)